MKYKIILPAIVSLILILVACSGGTGTSTTSSTTTSSTRTTSSPTATTFGDLAQSGQNVFAQKCALCHGNNGQGGAGPTIIGNTNIPLAYPTADKLLAKISTGMPLNNPGSLTASQYQQVLCYLLVQNKWVTSQTTFNADQLAQVTLSK